MRTTTLLTEEEINILKDLKQPDGTTIKSLLILGIVFCAIGLIAGLVVLSEPFLLIFAAFFLIPGVIMVISGLLKRRKFDAYFNNPPHGHQKQVITDKLLRTELVDRKLIRYHFTNYHLDLYIASGQGYHPANFRYRRVIEDITTLTHVPVKLSYVEYEPGINVLLDIRYNQYSLREDIKPVEEEDRKKSLSGNKTAVGCILGMAVIISVILGFITSFEWKTFSIILAFGAGPLLVIGLGAIWSASWTAQHAKTKIVIHTTITEVVGLRVQSGKTTTRNTFYRLGDGSLVHINPMTFKPGDNVLIQFMQRNNGKRGMLIEMIAV